MKKDYSKEDLKIIAEDLIEELRESDDGSVISTLELLEKCGYERRDFIRYDLTEIHKLVCSLAEANHIRLENTDNHDGNEKNPYSESFVVRNSEAQIKCPYCGNTNTARIIYGLPRFSDKMREKISKGKWALGGCCIRTVKVGKRMVRIDPKRLCNNCKKTFGSEPVFYKIKEPIDSITGEYYRDIVTFLKFSISGFGYGNTTVTILKTDGRALVRLDKRLRKQNGEPDCFLDTKEITLSEWDSIIDKLYGEMYLHEWYKSYVNDQILDGEQWNLEVTINRNHTIRYYGSNEYPAYWGELRKLFDFKFDSSVKTRDRIITVDGSRRIRRPLTKADKETRK